MTKQKSTRIAGVTFHNNIADGGENRQDLLRTLYGKPSVVNLEKTTYYNFDTDQAELAIKVISEETNKVLGFIPKNDIDKFVNIDKMILQVSCYKDNFSGALFTMQPPTPKQYGTVKSRLKSNRIAKLPIYDKLMYSYTIANS